MAFFKVKNFYMPDETTTTQTFVELLNELEKKIKESSKEDLASKKDLANKEDLTAKEDIYSLEKISLENKRKILTTQSLKKVHSLYTFYRFDQKKVQLQKLIECNGQKLPPTGTGDCCEPKLLCFAFKNHIRPISMTEIYYGKSKNKKSLFAYPPCDERCSYILPELLGLEILYKDKDIVVASKKSGLLSVPGRGKDKEDSAESRIRFLYQHEIEKDFVQIARIIDTALRNLGDKKVYKELNKQVKELTDKYPLWY